MISTLFALGLFLVGVPFMVVASLLAWDDVRTRGRSSGEPGGETNAPRGVKPGDEALFEAWVNSPPHHANIVVHRRWGL